MPDEGGRGSTDVRFDQVLSIRDGKVDPLLRCIARGIAIRCTKRRPLFAKYRNPNQIVAPDFYSSRRNLQLRTF